MLTDKNGFSWAKWNQTYTRIDKDSVSNKRKMSEEFRCVDNLYPIEDEIKNPTD